MVNTLGNEKMERRRAGQTEALDRRRAYGARRRRSTHPASLEHRAGMNLTEKADYRAPWACIWGAV